MLGGVLLAALSVARPAQVAAQGGRRISDDRFVLEGTIGEGSEILFRPWFLATTPEGRIIVFDGGDMQVRAFAATGEEVWHVGRKGHGPNEFSGVNDLQVDQDGRVLVLDNDNLRITRIGADGEIERSVRLPPNMVGRHVLPFGGPGETVMPMGTSVMVRMLGPDGSPLNERAYPREAAFFPNIVGDSYAVPLTDGAAIVFRWASKVIVVDRDGGVRDVFEGIEGRPFPEAKSYPVDLKDPRFKGAIVTRVDPRAEEYARDAAARGNRLYVLAGGSGKGANQIIDVYDLKSGSYLGSHRLPRKAANLALLPDGRFVTLEHSPVPVIRIWRLVDEAGS